jgi:hypothetical protein
MNEKQHDYDYIKNKEWPLSHAHAQTRDDLIYLYAIYIIILYSSNART